MLYYEGCFVNEVSLIKRKKKKLVLVQSHDVVILGYIDIKGINQTTHSRDAVNSTKKLYSSQLQAKHKE